MGKCTILIVVSYVSSFLWKLCFALTPVLDTKLAHWLDASRPTEVNGSAPYVPFEIGPIGVLLIALASLLLFAAVVAQCMAVYAMWKIVQNRDSLSPTVAVILGCVPIVAVLGMYFVVAGLPQQIARASQERGIQVESYPGLCLTACIMCSVVLLLGCVPLIGSLVYLAAVILTFIAQLLNAIGCDKIARHQNDTIQQFA